MSLIFDAMLPADIAAIAAIEARQHLTPWQASSFEDALRCNWHACVLRDDDQNPTAIAGYFVTMSVGDDEELLTITVAPDYIGQGHGRRLLDRWMQDSRARGVQRLFLEVRASNGSARRLYESVGFTIVGMRKNYYPVPADLAKAETKTMNQGQIAGREDAVLMQFAFQEARE